jgi:hypothetical protein
MIQRDLTHLLQSRQAEGDKTGKGREVESHHTLASVDIIP